MMLQGLCFREEAGARNLVFVREKSSDVKCEGCNVMCEESACLTLHYTGDARRSCSWTTILQQLRTKHARTGLAGALRMQVPL